jgi:succinate-semialdehyde dehydrogenase/glutarate-semialdehyde dehydrogenase
MEKRACSPDDDGNAQRFLADEVIQTTATESYVKYQALSVILVVMPWKYSIIRWCSGSLLPGSAAGNVGLLEHASNVRSRR